MIVFDLRCEAGHVFEAWFGSSAAYEDQRARSLVACPICDSHAVDKAVMAPRLAAKANAAPTQAEAAKVKAALKGLAAAQAKALEQSTWVGKRFADRARAMHEGAEPQATIHGQATLAEAKSLVADGVPVAPLPLPVVPPERSN
ncbi:DUF1178 family protein [uncultured Sphingomonas sp.]|uniref:DUF1178 family protein n=1 Tax=uncultured Sphingomonas sp. TaxID=158754 RepID=UPI0035C9CD8B